RAHRMGAGAGVRTGCAATDPRAGVRGAGDADRFPQAGAAGRCTAGFGVAAPLPSREHRVRAVDPARWRAAAGRGGALRGAGSIDVPPAGDPRCAVPGTDKTRRTRSPGRMMPLAMLLQATQIGRASCRERVRRTADAGCTTKKRDKNGSVTTTYGD